MSPVLLHRDTEVYVTPMKCTYIHFKTLFLFIINILPTMGVQLISFNPPAVRILLKTKLSMTDIINNFIDYEDGQEDTDYFRADKNMQRSSFPTNWKSNFLK
ncbi:UNVERIFIED_CONTAM: hypothetical protein NCL1_36861 [Trichonephila clavipes]